MAMSFILVEKKLLFVVIYLHNMHLKNMTLAQKLQTA